MHSSDLTKREIGICCDILSLLAEGKGFNYPELAKNNFIAESTVKTHISNIFVKLCVNSKAELVYKLSKMESLKHLQTVVKDAMRLKEENEYLCKTTNSEILQFYKKEKEKTENLIKILKKIETDLKQIIKINNLNCIKILIEKSLRELKNENY